MLTSLHFCLDSLQNPQNNNNVELTEANHEFFTATEANAPEPLVTEKNDSKVSDFADAAVSSDMYRAKTGHDANQPSKQGIKAAAVSAANTQSSATGSKVRNVTTKAKGFREGSKIGTSSDSPTQREQSNEKIVSMLPVLKDQSTSGPSSAKSKIPKRSTSDGEVKLPVTPDKPSMTEGTVKLQKQPRIKESLKSPTTSTKAARKPSFEEAKGVQSASGDISPTKITFKTVAKVTKEKSEVSIDSMNLSNGVEKGHEKFSGRTGQTPDVRKKQQSHPEKNAPLASKTHLPVSSPTRKKDDDRGTTYKRNSFGQTDLDKPTNSPEQEVSSEERPGRDTPPSLPDSPKKSKTAVKLVIVYAGQ